MSPSMVRTTSAMGASSNRKELGAPSGGGTGFAGPVTLALPPGVRGAQTAPRAGAGGGHGLGGADHLVVATDDARLEHGIGAGRRRRLGGRRVFACRPYHGACQQ